MTNLLYPKWKAAQQKAQTPDLSNAGTVVKALLVDEGTYTYAATHEFLSDIPSGARIATSPAVANKTVAAADGTFGCDPITITGVSGATVEAVVFFIDTGTPSTSRLIILFDTGVTGLVLTPNGGDVQITLNAGGLWTP